MESPSAVSAGEQVSHVLLFHSLLISTLHKGINLKLKLGSQRIVFQHSILTIYISHAGLILCKKCAGSGYSKRL